MIYRFNIQGTWSDSSYKLINIVLAIVSKQLENFNLDVVKDYIILNLFIKKTIEMIKSLI